MKTKKFKPTERIKSFGHAFNGLRILLKFEHNSRIHLVLTVLAIILSFALDINTQEFLIILLVIGAVFTTEIFNSVTEYICNFVSPEYNEIIKKIKDLSAAAVLISAATAAIAGIIIFLPKIIGLL